MSILAMSMACSLSNVLVMCVMNWEAVTLVYKMSANLMGFYYLLSMPVWRNLVVPCYSAT